MLCQRCQELFTLAAELSDSDALPHQTCIEDWKASIESICMICATVWFQYTPDEQEKLSQLEGYEFETYGLLNIFVSVGDNSEFDLEFELGPSVAEVVGFPRRTIEFKARREEDPVICLVETSKVTPTGPYMTLSHSWGKGHIITLNKHSYQDLLRGMPLSSLPPTFRDACIITRQVGVNYLWIDALCIFQDKDDLSDWSREASLMHKVYSFSYCNIVAAENKDSSEPIFRTRDPKRLIPPTTETLVRNRLCSSQVDKPSSSNKYIVDYGGSWSPVTNAHINTRGWVMQERLLSPRALHFVAFSAVARLYASYLSDEYVAGMWRKNLHNDLLWYGCDNYEDVPSRYEPYIAPSWSWASYKGKVFMMNYEHDRVEYLCEVDDCKLEHVTNDEMGAVRSGWLRLSGHLRQLKLLRRASEGNDMWSLAIDNIEYDPQQYRDGETANLWSSIWLDEPQTDFDEESKGGNLYCMLARHHLFNDTGDASNMWDFLLFQPVDPSRAIFRRIGIARTRTGKVNNPYPISSVNGGASSESVKDGHDTTTLPCAAYPGGVHSIYVI
ncbi:hypothetical protein HYE67_009978 [Fusarium culmorum]|uniref:Heterokaryon incompatibility domain-containing protein n=1 Tax=Fusarium culmorum TaxID=5516 RepID=A0A7S8DFT8_FUSCU|nr:hypothetical protein HYE67_009978 [Fusarium culmorum]